MTRRDLLAAAALPLASGLADGATERRAPLNRIFEERYAVYWRVRS